MRAPMLKLIFFDLDFSFSAHSVQFFLAYHNVFVAPNNLNYEPKVNLLIKVSFDNKYGFTGGFIPLAFKSSLLFLFSPFSHMSHPSSTKKKGY